jgi:hypothetical protein
VLPTAVQLQAEATNRAVLGAVVAVVSLPQLTQIGSGGNADGLRRWRI